MTDSPIICYRTSPVSVQPAQFVPVPRPTLIRHWQKVPMSGWLFSLPVTYVRLSLCFVATFILRDLTHQAGIAGGEVLGDRKVCIGR